MRKTTTTDDKGRIVIPREIREKYGDRYKVVELRDRIELVPVHDDPVEGLREAVGDAFDANGDFALLDRPQRIRTVGLNHGRTRLTVARNSAQRC